jgi:hypothetical protein
LIESAPHRLPWIRIFAEAVVVVGSILLAFAIDAWWDYRGELRQEDEIVQALEAEFTLNREKLEQDIEGVREYTAAAQRLLRAARSNAVEAQGVDSLGTDLWQSLSWRTANLSTANLDVIVSTGRLDLIRDAQLRSALAGWKALLEDMAEEEEYEWREIVERYRPYMGRFVATWQFRRSKETQHRLRQAGQHYAVCSPMRSFKVACQCVSTCPLSHFEIRCLLWRS